MKFVPIFFLAAGTLAASVTQPRTQSHTPAKTNIQVHAKASLGQKSLKISGFNGQDGVIKDFVVNLANIGKPNCVCKNQPIQRCPQIKAAVSGYVNAIQKDPTAAMGAFKALDTVNALETINDPTMSHVLTNIKRWKLTPNDLSAMSGGASNQLPKKTTGAIQHGFVVKRRMDGVTIAAGCLRILEAALEKERESPNHHPMIDDTLDYVRCTRGGLEFWTKYGRKVMSFMKEVLH
jgi:hypothetical protein